MRREEKGSDGCRHSPSSYLLLTHSFPLLAVETFRHWWLAVRDQTGCGGERASGQQGVGPPYRHAGARPATSPTLSRAPCTSSTLATPPDLAPAYMFPTESGEGAEQGLAGWARTEEEMRRGDAQASQRLRHVEHNQGEHFHQCDYLVAFVSYVHTAAVARLLARGALASELFLDQLYSNLSVRITTFLSLPSPPL